MTKTLGQVAVNAYCKYSISTGMGETANDKTWEQVAQAVIVAHEAAQVKPWPPPRLKDLEESETYLAWIPKYNEWTPIYRYLSGWILSDQSEAVGTRTPTHYRPMPPNPEGL